MRASSQPVKPKQKPKETRRGLALPKLLERRSGLLAVFLVLVATGRIVSTYAVFSHTVDEPAHIGCGMEWLDKGAYTLEPQHPPVARAAAAIGPYLLGIRFQNILHPDRWACTREGLSVLYADHRYDRNLAAARWGVLPFFWIACAVVYLWSRRLLGPGPAVLAVLLFSFLPPVLAHAGLATTDMALTAFLGAAFLCGWMWMEIPTIARATLFGAATGLAIVSKFSFLAFFPACAALALATYWIVERPPFRSLFTRDRVYTLLVAVATACVVVAVAYRFQFSPLFQGIQDVRAHNAAGHPAYLLGERSRYGFWYYFPVVLAVKTPLAFLVLVVLGIRRRLYVPMAFAAGILSVAMSSHINIAVRHILPIYIALSIFAAAGLTWLIEQRPWTMVAAGVLLLWFGGSSVASHPDYLAYFNEAAGDQPWNILVDSDLDWGQDVKRLGKRLKEAGAEWVWFTQMADGDLENEQGFPMVLPSDQRAPAPGWNAVSVTTWKATRMMLYDSHPEITVWPDTMKPMEKIGKSILLWYFPPGNQRPLALVEREIKARQKR